MSSHLSLGRRQGLEWHVQHDLEQMSSCSISTSKQLIAKSSIFLALRKKRIFWSQSPVSASPDLINVDTFSTKACLCMSPIITWRHQGISQAPSQSQASWNTRTKWDLDGDCHTFWSLMPAAFCQLILPHARHNVIFQRPFDLVLLLV